MSPVQPTRLFFFNPVQNNYIFQFKTPAPSTYQTRCTDPLEFEPAYKPFSAAAARFPVYKRDVEDVTPGYIQCLGPYH